MLAKASADTPLTHHQHVGRHTTNGAEEVNILIKKCLYIKFTNKSTYLKVNQNEKDERKFSLAHLHKL